MSEEVADTFIAASLKDLNTATSFEALKASAP